MQCITFYYGIANDEMYLPAAPEGSQTQRWLCHSPCVITSLAVPLARLKRVKVILIYAAITNSFTNYFHMC